MRAVVLTEFGEPSVLRLADIPDPQPAPDEVLVDVRATALNRADLLQRRGLYPNPFPDAFDVPGMEFAGTVAAVGERVRAWKPGDEVMGIVAGGAYAERLVIHERQAMRIPQGVSLADAAVNGYAVKRPDGYYSAANGAKLSGPAITVHVNTGALVNDGVTL